MKINKNNKYIVFSKDQSKYAIAPAFYMEAYIKKNKLTNHQFAMQCQISIHTLRVLLEKPRAFNRHICKGLAQGTGTPIEYWQRVSDKYLLDLAEINKE